MKYSGLLLLLVLPFGAQANDIFVNFRNQQEIAYQGEKSIDLLEKSLSQDLTAEQRAMAQFAIGTLSREVGLRDKAEEYLNAAKASNELLKAYVLFELGSLYLKDGKLDRAKSHFDQVLKLNPQRDLRDRTRFELGKIASTEKQWKSATEHFQFVERQMRSRSQYPEILLHLVRAERERGRSWHSCRWARQLYSRYPHSEVTKNWTMELHAVKIDDKRLGCVATLEDQKRRVMWLQLTGHPERARQEITHLQEKLGESRKYDAALLWASFLSRDGDPRGGLNQLLPFYNEKKEDFDYLMELGSYSSRAGEVHAAVGAYYKAYKSNKKSSKARQALYRAAYLSYQYQDYDGAVQKFLEFNQAYGGSGLIRSSKWHLAWIDYLRGNYEASYNSFTEIKTEKRRRARYWKGYPNDRIDYWRAMSLLKMNKKDEAYGIFARLKQDDPYNYYSVSSRYRINRMVEEGYKIDEEMVQRSLAGEPPLVRITGQSGESQESEEDFISEDEEIVANGEVEALEDEEVSDPSGDPESTGLVIAEEQAPEEKEAIPVFSNPRLRGHYNRAQQLMALGFYDWARWDLYEVERRTSNRTHLQSLMEKYENIGAYHRSSYIGEVYFRSQRQKEGISSESPLWLATYPRPYSQSVKKSAKEFEIPQEFIWSIMRAESFYRQDAESPVGALGLMQVMPSTGKHLARILGEANFEPGQLRKSEVAIRFGTSYLKRLQGMFGDDIPLISAGYNAGPHRVKSWLLHFGNLDMDEFIEHIPFSETRNYVKKIVYHYEIYTHIYGGKRDSLGYIVQPVRARYKGPMPLKEDWAS